MSKKEELRKSIARIKRNIKSRISGLPSNSKPVQLYNELVKNTKRITKKMHYKTAEAIYNKWYQLNEKSVMTKKGYAQYSKMVDIISRYKIAEETTWSLYDRLVEENQLLEKYKYEIVQTITEYKVQGMSEEEIRERILKLGAMALISKASSFEQVRQKYEKNLIINWS